MSESSRCFAAEKRASASLRLDWKAAEEAPAPAGVETRAEAASEDAPGVKSPAAKGAADGDAAANDDATPYDAYEEEEEDEEEEAAVPAPA